MSISNNKNDPEKRAAIQRKPTLEKPNLSGDWTKFYLLIILYTIQGFPIGLSMALSTILQERKMITYSEQAVFSISLWPYLLKIMWAPIVDALYIQQIGRRKSWLVPLQLLMGSFLLFMASNIEEWLPKTGVANLKMLGFVVFALNFLSSTQDIVVDGWALTMFKKRNVGYCSTCNSIGVPIGMFISSICFVLLVSENFRNKFIHAEVISGGLITMHSFLYFWAVVIFCVTIIVTVFKKEKKTRNNGNENINVFQNYKLLLEILQLPNMKVLAIALLTARIGFSTTEAVTNLKLIDAGVSNDEIMLISIVMYAVKFAMPMFVSKYITSQKPMSYYLKMTPIRLLWCLVFGAMVYYTQHFLHNRAGMFVPPPYYFLILGFIFLINEMLSLFMMLAIMSFFCRLSDPRFGGTYMTLFNTFYFVGWLIPNTLSLKMVALLTFSQCSNDIQNVCSTPELTDACKLNNGICIQHIDGYYLSVAICTFIGLIWYIIFKNIIKKYQSLNLSYWMVFDKESITHEEREPGIISTA